MTVLSSVLLSLLALFIWLVAGTFFGAWCVLRHPRPKAAASPGAPPPPPHAPQVPLVLH